MSDTNGQGSEKTPVNEAVIPSYEIAAIGRNPQVKMSFNPQTAEGAVRLVQATLQEVPKLEDMRDKELSIVHWMAHPAQMAGDTEGEVKEFNRIIVWDDKENAYSCGSTGVDKSIGLLELTRGKAPWNPPVKVKVKIRRLANKNNFMVLEPDIESLKEALKAKR